MSAPDSSHRDKVSPRRKNPGQTVLNGIRYDSEQAPVLLQLPDLAAPQAVVQPAVDPVPERRIDAPATKAEPPRTASRRPANRSKSKHTRTTRNNNKLLIAGAIVGVLLIAIVFLSGGRDTGPVDERAWERNGIDPAHVLLDPDIAVPAGEGEPSYAQEFDRDSPAETAHGTSNLANYDSPATADAMPDAAMAGGPALADHQTSVSEEPACEHCQDGNLTAPCSCPVLTSSPAPTQGWPAEIESSGPTTVPTDSTHLGPRPFQYPNSGQQHPGTQSSGYDGNQLNRYGGAANQPPAQSPPPAHNSILTGSIEIPNQPSLR